LARLSLMNPFSRAGETLLTAHESHFMDSN
jgi:hypothetical protein